MIKKVMSKKKPAVKWQISTTVLLILTISVLGSCLFFLDFTFLQYLVFIPCLDAIIIAILSWVVKETPLADEIDYFPKICIAIPAYNEEDVLERCVSANIEQIDYSNYDIYIINDGSLDKTGEIAEKLSKKYDNVYVHTRPHNPDENKNHALCDLAVNVLDDSYRYICVVDADGILDNDFFIKANKKFRANDKLVACQGRVRIYNTNDFYSKNTATEFTNMLSTWKSKGNNANLGGNAQITQLNIFRKFAPLCLSLVEDHELSILIYDAGYEITAILDSGVSQEAAEGFSNFIKQRTRWCQGGLQVLFSWTWKIIFSKKIKLKTKISEIMSLISCTFIPFLLMCLLGFMFNLVAWLMCDTWIIQFNAPMFVGVVNFVGFAPLLFKGCWMCSGRVLTTIKKVILFIIYSYLQPIYYFKSLTNLIVDNSGWYKTKRHTKALQKLQNEK